MSKLSINRLRSQSGFTLIELIMVIVILAILSIVAVPIYVDLRTEARTASEQGVVAGVRAGIVTYFVDPSRGDRTSFPTNAQLDPGAVAACSAAAPCFEGVLAQGAITSDWVKTAANTWTGPTGTTYTYTQVGAAPGTADDGTFV